MKYEIPGLNNSEINCLNPGAESHTFGVPVVRLCFPRWRFCCLFLVSTLVQSLCGCLEKYGRETKTRHEQQRPSPRDVKDTKSKLPG